jgi:hypothetical protein
MTPEHIVAIGDYLTDLAVSSGITMMFGADVSSLLEAAITLYDVLNAEDREDAEHELTLTLLEDTISELTGLHE